jgi:hypothetical protein
MKRLIIPRDYRSVVYGLALIGLLTGLALAGDKKKDRPHAAHGFGAVKERPAVGPRPGDVNWPGSPREVDPGCLTCHGDIENATESMGFWLSCTFCHGGDGFATTKEEAHVQPTRPVIMDQTVPPLDYDLPYQQFVNPSNLRVVQNTCRVCHPWEVDSVTKSMMATAAGHYSGGLYLNAVVDTKMPIYGTFAISDDDYYVPTEAGAVHELKDLIVYNPQNDPALISTHFQAVPSQACARCHLWSRGAGYRGAADIAGLYRADGCAACHMIYANDGLSRSADASINHNEPGHPMFHSITRAIPTEQCVHCHHRGARIGLSFQGLAQMPPRLPSGPGVPGSTDERFNRSYHFSDPRTNPADVHHQSGMHCIDCHTRDEVMGDGNLYGHMDQATKIDCRHCHGTPTEEGSLHDKDGNRLTNVDRDEQGHTVLFSKVSGPKHDVTQIRDLVDPSSPRFNPRAACAMNENHIKSEGGLECYACHTAWTPNCFGCHFERDETRMGLNLMTRQMEVGRAATNNMIFETFKYFMMGANAAGRLSPYIVGCQTIADVTVADGTKIIDFAMPETAAGLSGLALNPVHPHTIRGRGEVRTCAECHRSPPSLGFGSGNYAVARRHAYVAGDAGVQVFDRWTDPRNPAAVGLLPLRSPAAFTTLPNVIEGTADFLYVASRDAGLAIYDRKGTTLDAPVMVLSDLRALDVARAARYLYVVVEGEGVRIYDNRNPGQVELVSTLSVPTARRVVPWGIHLLIAAGADGLVVAEIANHHTPRIVAHLSGLNAVDVRPYAHYQTGNDFAVRAYVADPNYGVHVVDLLPDHDAPRLMSGLPLPGARGLDTYTRYVPAGQKAPHTPAGAPSREHDYLYVAAGNNGLHIFDMTWPDAITQVAAVPTLGGEAEHVDVTSQLAPPGVDDYALVAAGRLGLLVVNVTKPWEPVLVRTVPVAGARRVFVEVQQMDRFLDEQGTLLKDNTHPFIKTLTRADIVRILGAPITPDDCTCPRSPGDMDGDGVLTGKDIAMFVGVMVEGAVKGYLCAADVNGDGMLDEQDAALFVACLLNGRCP